MFHGILPRLLGLTLMTVIPLTALIGGLLWEQWQKDKAYAFKSANSEAQLVAALLDDQLSDLFSFLNGRSQGISLDRAEAASNDAMLRKLKGYAPAYVSNILVFAADGHNIGTSGDHVGSRNFAGDRDYFQKVMAGAPLAVGEPVRGRTTNHWIVTIARPVKDDQGNVGGVLTVGILLEHFHVAVKDRVLPSGGVILVSDDNGFVLTRSVDGASWVGRVLSGADKFAPQLAASDAGGEVRWADGVTRISGAEKMHRAPWIVSVGIPHDVALAAVWSQLISGVSVSVLTIFAALGLAVGLASRLTRPLRQLTADARNLTFGGNHHRTQVNAPGEVGTLAATFNIMAESLAERYRELELARQAAMREANERAALQETERQSKEMLATIISASPVGIVCTALDRRITVWSGAAERIYGYSAKEMVGQYAKIVPPEARELSESLLRRAMNGEVLTQIEVKRRRKDGRLIDVEVSAAALRDEAGLVRGVAWTHNDISIRKAAEARLVQSQKMEAVGHLTGGIAHDFNNLLLVIIGNLDLLVETACLDDVSLELVKPSLAAAMSGADLANGLLAFSRQQTLSPKHIEINALIADQIDLLKRALGANVTMVAELADDAYPVMADPTQLRCVLMNLAVNARDVMPNGGTLTFRTFNAVLGEADVLSHEAVQPGDFTVIEVSDTGAGIAPENLQRIFEPFFTTKDVGKGTGLGLSMVHGFFKQSNGRITVASEVGKGTTFRMYLPRSPVAVVTASEVELVPEQLVGRERILVVDDDLAVRKIVTRQLAALGYVTIEAGSAAEALDIIAGGQSFDLLFTDVVMPGELSGVDLARLAREQRQNLKVLLTSGYPDLKTHHGSIENIAMIKKPYRRDDLHQALREALAA